MAEDKLGVVVEFVVKDVRAQGVLVGTVMVTGVDADGYFAQEWAVAVGVGGEGNVFDGSVGVWVERGRGCQWRVCRVERLFIAVA